jgi:hypothetical protein
MQEHPGCWLEPILEHPRFHGSMRREASSRCAACLHQPAVFWLWRRGLHRSLSSVAELPRLENKLPSGPHRGKE